MGLSELEVHGFFAGTGPTEPTEESQKPWASTVYRETWRPCVLAGPEETLAFRAPEVYGLISGVVQELEGFIGLAACGLSCLVLGLRKVQALKDIQGDIN